MKLQDVYEGDFEKFNNHWHKEYLRKSDGDVTNDGMYCNAQYDEIPYLIWGENPTLPIF